MWLAASIQTTNQYAPATVDWLAFSRAPPNGGTWLGGEGFNGEQKFVSLKVFLAPVHRPPSAGRTSALDSLGCTGRKWDDSRQYDEKEMTNKL